MYEVRVVTPKAETCYPLEATIKPAVLLQVPLSIPADVITLRAHVPRGYHIAVFFSSVLKSVLFVLLLLRTNIFPHDQCACVGVWCMCVHK